MKVIAKELQKNNLNLISLFVVSYVVIIFVFAEYINRNSAMDIYNLDSFLQYEVGEFGEKLKAGKSLERLFEGAIEEAPKILGTTIVFEQNGEKYPRLATDVGIVELENQKYSDRVQNLGIYNLQFMKKRILIKDYSPIDIYIIKNMAHERDMIKNILLISCILIFTTLCISIFISKRFYKSFIESLKELQDLTNKISLENIDEKVDINQRYLEFDKVIKSYNDMLDRLVLQTQAQVDFVNNASHELKTPIFIIGSYVNMIKRWGIENRDITQEALVAIEGEIKNMGELVNKLLFLAKRDFTKLENTVLDLKVLIEEIVKELNVLYPNQEFELKLKSFEIFSDEFLLKQLFKNIVENSIKYGKKNPITIDMNKQNKKIIVEIIDRGEGISEENLEKVYDKFFRADEARGREGKSHGLGLAIVKQISEILKLDIDIESELGVGTEVKIFLDSIE